MILVKLKDISVMEKISECKYTKIAKICRSYLVIFFCKTNGTVVQSSIVVKKEMYCHKRRSCLVDANYLDSHPHVLWASTTLFQNKHWFNDRD